MADNLGSVLINAEKFFIQDCGGNGACLFKCIAETVGNTEHRTVRRKIVNHVIDNWNDFSLWVHGTLRKKTREEYRCLMSSVTSYGSEIEVRAASELFKINITLFRKYEERFYPIKFNIDSHEQHQERTYLLFTGICRRKMIWMVIIKFKKNVLYLGYTKTV